MTVVKKTESSPIRIKFYTVVFGLLWSALVAMSLIWNMHQHRQGTLESARIQARDSFMKDITFRRWNAQHSGVYVPVTHETPPNPHLDVEERDIRTASGKVLTLVNPAYMTRQVHELSLKAYGIRSHITSLNPIRSENAPDPWEVQALEGFERGEKEVSAVRKINGEAYMRLMRPLFTEKGCLKCHRVQGYKVGDVRGGISVSVPMSSLWNVENSYTLTLSLWHGFLWLAGVTGLGFGSHRLNRQIIKRQQEQETLRVSEGALRQANTEWVRTFDAVPDLVMILDDKHRIVKANKAMADKLGVAPGEATGLTCYEHVHGTKAPPSGCPHSLLLGDGREHSAEIFEERLGGDFIVTVNPLHDAKGRLVGSVHVARDITERKAAEKEREKLIRELKDALANVKQLSGLLPICSGCKKIRDDKGYWNRIENYIQDHSEADFSHGICPECVKKLYPDLNIDDK